MPQPELLYVRRYRVPLVQIVDGGRQHRHQLHSLLAQVFAEQSAQRRIEFKQSIIKQRCCGIGDGCKPGQSWFAPGLSVSEVMSLSSFNRRFQLLGSMRRADAITYLLTYLTVKNYIMCKWHIVASR